MSGTIVLGGNYKAYPEYKYSNVEWVGEVPKHWLVKPLFGVATTESVKNEDGEEKNVLSLSYGNIIRRDVDKNFGLLPESFNTYQLVNPGELILRLTDLQNDKRSLRVGHAKERGIITSAYLKLVAKEGALNDYYLYRLLHSYDTTKVFYGMGGGLRQSMKFQEMRRLLILVPSLDEQQKIANFLDHETAKIDTLIAKQQQLITLLKEKRQAVISHAVTKGLNPNAPMRDSGVEWVKEIPEHWDMLRLSFALKLQSGDTITSDNIEKTGKYLVYGGNGVRGYTSRYNCDGEYVLIGRQGALCGNINMASGQFFASEHAVVVYPRKPFNNIYLAEMLRYMDLGQYSVSAAQPGVSVERLDLLKVIMPPESEQITISKVIIKENSVFESLTKECDAMIALLRERRTALISAAVTGKIDLRNWQAPQASNNHKEVAQ
jgi:type I restriction enzyme S subunit